MNERKVRPCRVGVSRLHKLQVFHPVAKNDNVEAMKFDLERALIAPYQALKGDARPKFTSLKNWWVAAGRCPSLWSMGNFSGGVSPLPTVR